MKSFAPHTPSSTIPQPTSPTSPLPKPNPLPPLLPTPNLPICCLTPVELLEKREKGLSYNYDQKYSVNHHCCSKFLLLLSTDDVETDSGEEFQPLESEEDIIIGDISSLNALLRQANPCSLHLISAHNFQVLINSGSTHNFIKPALAEHLGLPIQSTSPFCVYIGNGDFLVCKYVCPQVAMTMQGTNFTLDLFIFPIEEPDVVLGVQWLQLLGHVSHDYSTLSMEFYWNGSLVILCGNLELPSSLITLHQFQALIRSANIHSLFALQPLSKPKEALELTTSTSSSFQFPSPLPKPFTTLLHNYSNLFCTATSLPLHRTFDHKINLLPNTNPVNVRPYRYPYF